MIRWGGTGVLGANVSSAWPPAPEALEAQRLGVEPERDHVEEARGRPGVARSGHAAPAGRSPISLAVRIPASRL